MAHVENEDRIKEICKNKKNINIINDLLHTMAQDKLEEKYEVFFVLNGVFGFFLKEKLWCNDVLKSITDESELHVNNWLKTSYNAFIGMLLDGLCHDVVSFQIECYQSLLKFVKYEQCLYKIPGSDKLHFPFVLFERIIKHILLKEDINGISKNLKLNCRFLDLNYYTMKAINSILSDESVPNKSWFMLNNAYVLLMNVTKSEGLETSTFLDSTGVDLGDIKKSFYNTFSSAWLSLLQCKLSSNLHNKILINLDSKIMPHLSDPKLLIDFLSDSYDNGGITSLLALNGIFVLMTEYNLDFPDFYKKLYTLLDVDIFSRRYKSRFFYLLDVFLSSTHLPVYLIAAFIKKLSHISLHTPAPDLEMLMMFIRNLIIRHPSCKILIHHKNTNDPCEGISDPYNYDESDPALCNAVGSSLWELNTLKHHYASEVKKVVSNFKKDFPGYETNIDEYCNKDYEQLFFSKMQDLKDLPPVNFEKGMTIFSDLDKEMWNF